MRTEKFSVTKTVALPDGTEVERKANVILNLPETNEEAAPLNGNLVKWAAFGLKAYARVMANNRLMGTSSGDVSKKEMRQFNESLRTLIEVMDMEKQGAIDFILGKPQFSKIAKMFEELRAGDKEITIDYSDFTQVPTPRSFTEKDGASTDDDDAGETEA